MIGVARSYPASENGLTIELQQQIAGTERVAHFYMCRERFAVEPDGIDTHMDQQLNPAVTQQPYGVTGLKQGGHLSRKKAQ
ncbi:Uncharacterised protein [Pantoea agglomerans]|uniref:Uncharacterized protein n=1 Tax=Enterobacter agglomerans TaxID=549 RepID=A0A379LQS4_ENTAG|nr:Uncharacterised protein [Pantoea agglomerans]